MASRFHVRVAGRRSACSRPPRPPGRRPAEAEGPLCAWAWKGSIRERDSGPLSGYRVAVKDNIAVRGVPMLVGSEVMEGFEPRDDAVVAARVLVAVGEIVGKTAVPGLCFDGAHVTGCPPATPVNPYEHDHWPGDSSSGNAVALVAGEADVALGTDTAGSIRIPASWTGCCGLKPTYGRAPSTGIFPIELTLDHTGPMARTVADGGGCRAALRDDLAGLTIGILGEGFGLPGASEPDARGRRRSLGGDPLRRSDGAARLGRRRRNQSARPLQPGRGRVLRSAADRSLVESYDEALSRVDLLVLPTTPMRAFRKNQEEAEIEEVVETAWSNVQNTAPLNVTGTRLSACRAAPSTGCRSA